MEVENELSCYDALEFSMLSRNESPKFSNFTIEDIFAQIEVMLFTEASYKPNPNYMIDVQHTTLRPEWRYHIVEWLLSYPEEFDLKSDTVFTAMNFMDRYLSKIPSDINMLKMLGMVCIFIASKMNQLKPIHLCELEQLLPGTITEHDLKEMEMKVYDVLDWKLNPITPQYLASVFLYDLPQCEQVRLQIYYDVFLDLAICELSMLRFLPSTIAASGIICGYGKLNQEPLQWLNFMRKMAPSVFNSEALRSCCVILMDIFRGHCSDLAPSKYEFSEGKDCFLDRVIALATQSPTTIQI